MKKEFKYYYKNTDKEYTGSVCLGPDSKNYYTGEHFQYNISKPLDRIRVNGDFNQIINGVTRKYIPEYDKLESKYSLSKPYQIIPFKPIITKKILEQGQFDRYFAVKTNLIFDINPKFIEISKKQYTDLTKPNVGLFYSVVKLTWYIKDMNNFTAEQLNKQSLINVKNNNPAFKKLNISYSEYITNNINSINTSVIKQTKTKIFAIKNNFIASIQNDNNKHLLNFYLMYMKFAQNNIDTYTYLEEKLIKAELKDFLIYSNSNIIDSKPIYIKINNDKLKYNNKEGYPISLKFKFNTPFLDIINLSEIITNLTEVVKIQLFDDNKSPNSTVYPYIDFKTNSIYYTFIIDNKNLIYLNLKLKQNYIKLFDNADNFISTCEYVINASEILPVYPSTTQQNYLFDILDLKFNSWLTNNFLDLNVIKLDSNILSKTIKFPFTKKHLNTGLVSGYVPLNFTPISIKLTTSITTSNTIMYVHNPNDVYNTSNVSKNIKEYMYLPYTEIIPEPIINPSKTGQFILFDLSSSTVQYNTLPTQNVNSGMILSNIAYSISNYNTTASENISFSPILVDITKSITYQKTTSSAAVNDDSIFILTDSTSYTVL